MDGFKDNELRTVTIVKVIMMLCVVLGHTTAVFTGTEWGEAVRNLK